MTAIVCRQAGEFALGSFPLGTRNPRRLATASARPSLFISTSRSLNRPRPTIGGGPVFVPLRLKAERETVEIR